MSSKVGRFHRWALCAVWLLLAVARPAAAEGCLAGEFNPFTPYTGTAALTTVANNPIFIGNARLQLSSGGTAGGTMTIGSHFATDIGVRTAQAGAVSPTLYHDSTYDFRDPANLAQYLPVSDLTFVLYDIDAGDNVTVNAYDQNGTLIALAASNYNFVTSSGTPVVSYAGANRFTSSLSDVGDQRGTVLLNFTGLQVRRVVLRYWDVSAAGTYTAASWGGCNASLVLNKVTQTFAGGPFGFTLTNTSRNTGATVSTSAANVPVQADGNVATAGVQAFGITTAGTAVTIQESSVPTGWTLSGVVCTNVSGTSVGSLSGTTYTLPAAATTAGALLTCTFTNAPPQADVQVNKSSSVPTVATGQVVSYTLIARKNGPAAANGSVLTDLAGPGQTCSTPSTTATCTATGGAVCPGATVPVATLLGGGVTLATFPANSQVSFVIQCTVTASGFTP